MPHDIDLRKLAGLSGPERAFLSLYLAHPSSVETLEKRFRNCRAMLTGKDERQQFDENVRLIQDHLKKEDFEHGSLAIFACWTLDLFEAHPVKAPLPDVLRADSSPYLRPLTELLDEYENYVVVITDNTSTRILLVTAEQTELEGKIKGGVKNHVRKGGWSQQRYERRRDKALHHYAKQIAEALAHLEEEQEFHRIILVGSKETIHELEHVLPDRLQKKVAGTRAVDLGKGEHWVEKEAYELFVAAERHTEEQLWERIQAQYLSGGLATVGLDDVLDAARQGRVSQMIVLRDFKPTGVRCRECEHLTQAAVEACSSCNSASVFEVDLVEEVVELLLQSGAETDYVDKITALEDVGNIAALLRY